MEYTHYKILPNRIKIEVDLQPRTNEAKCAEQVCKLRMKYLDLYAWSVLIWTWDKSILYPSSFLQTAMETIFNKYI